jgi:multiple sugar transport system ATP-binding protein
MNINLSLTRSMLAKGLWSGTVDYSENLGADIYAHVDIGKEALVTIRYQSDQAHQAGTRLDFGPREEKIHRFGPDGLRLEDSGTNQ